MVQSNVQILKEIFAGLEEKGAISNDPRMQHNDECEKSNDVDHEQNFGAENMQKYDETVSSQYVENQEMVTTKRKKITMNISNLQVV